MTSYTTFMKHAEKVTKAASSGRPILKGVCHSADGSVVVTDSHRLYILENGYKTDVQTVIDPKTGTTIDGNYPDTSLLLPYEDDALVTLEIDVANALAAVKAMYAGHKALNNHKRHITLEISQGIDECAYLKVGGIDSPFNAQYLISAGKVDKLESTFVQPQYLIDALSLFKDSGEPTATLRLYGPVRPITIKNSDVTALMLPVRTF